MPSYEHTLFLKNLTLLSQPPTEEALYLPWVKGETHLELLNRDSRMDEVILYASTHKRTPMYASAFIHAVLTMESDVTPPERNDLLNWSSSPYRSRAAFVWTSSEPDEVRVEFYDTHSRPATMKHSQNLVFGCQMEGVDDDDATYYELLQEFVHASDIHWRQEQQAYCRLDENGDIEPVVSITKGRNSEPSTLITCKREPLEKYLAATDNVLVRFVEIMMVKQEEFTSWDAAVREEYAGPEELFSYRLIHPNGHVWTRGTQILRPTTPKQVLFRSFTDPHYREMNREYASFIIHDRRNDKTVEVSTKPSDTTNYFEAENNSLPYEVSPAFFRPEVLSKYKADRDKYTIDETNRFISCRGAWHLKGYDINEAGQVHAYICYLRGLPYQEQLHWKAHNERPKGTISERALYNDIKGVWSFHVKPLERVLMILQEWNQKKLGWWRIHDESLFHKVNTPVSNSREEWAQAFQDLAIVVIEGFQVSAIRSLLGQQSIPYEQNERSLSLLEKLLNVPDKTAETEIKLNGLRQVQRIRTLARSHGGGSEAENLRRNAVNTFGTYRKHFEHVCDTVAAELETIESCITSGSENTDSRS